MHRVPLDWESHVTWIRCGIALVWFVFGVVFKALDAVPRHRQIVARVLGERMSRPFTLFVASGEAFLGLWMLTGYLLPFCVGVQTIILVTMNALEIRYARDLLLSPRLMILANLVFLCLGWYVALAGLAG